MANILQDVREHLQTVQDDPSLPLDISLLDSLDRHVSGSLKSAPRKSLLVALSALLPTLQQDPEPVTSLIERLVDIPGFSYHDVLLIRPDIDFTAGLRSPIPQIALITLQLIQTARYDINAINLIAGQRDLVAAIVESWLHSTDTAVAQEAGNVLSQLLLHKSDERASRLDPLTAENLMWRRILRDEDIYRSIFSSCSLLEPKSGPGTNTRQKTLAQGRLMDLIKSLCMTPLWTTQIPEIEFQYGCKDGGLLEFVASRMVDLSDDLMLSTSIEFCSDLIECHAASHMEMAPSPLACLKACGAHTRCISYYLDNKDAPSWVQTASARYLGIYCSLYTNDLLHADALARKITQVLNNGLSQCSASAWHSGRVPHTELFTLSLMPSCLILDSGGGHSMIAHIDPDSPHPQVLTTLASLFSSLKNTASADGNVQSANEAASRALYFLYLEAHHEMWAIVIRLAETIASLDAALAAHHFMQRLMQARWRPLPPTAFAGAVKLPTESWLQDRCNNGQALPQTGIEAILATGAANRILPYLMKPAQVFSGTVGGGRGDIENAAWKIACAKYDVLIVFRDSLRTLPSTADTETILASVSHRIAQGPMGASSQVGSQVATMER